MEDSFNLSLEDEQTTFLKKIFLMNLYNYYVNNGYYNIITSQVVYILNNTFILLYTLFLVKCVNWNILFTLDSPIELKDTIYMENLFKLNFYTLILVLTFIIYILCKVIYLIYDSFNYKYIKSFYNDKLNIKEEEISILKWENIIERLKETENIENLDIFYINNKITCKDNYLITLFDKDIIKVDYLTQLMEWNIRFCFINPIFNKEFKYNIHFLNLKPQFVNDIKNKIKFVAIINFIFMPILLPFIIIKNLFKNGEQFYNKPQLLFSRHWTLKAKWKFRNYNELYHEFHEKILKSMVYANDYSNQFPNKLIETFTKLIILICSSFFIVLVFLSIVNEKVLLNLYISDNKTVIWFIGLFATIIAVLKSVVRENIIYYPDEKLNEIKTIINSIEKEESKDKKHIHYFFNLYQFHIITLIKDVFYTVLVPFELYKLSYRTKNIMAYLSEITINNAKYGHTNKYSLMEREKDKKTMLSKETFLLNNENYLIS